MSHAGIECEPFGVTAEGLRVERYTLRNASGTTVRMITYGATVTELLVADRCGRFADVVLGFDHLRQYETERPYFGCTVGRVAFRITNAEFSLDGQAYHLTRNAGAHHLHGGTRGLSHVVWQAQPLPSADAPSVRFHHVSPAGDQGYPGNLDVTVVFTFTARHELCIDYTATTDHATPVNLTHHGYFNLAGNGSGNILRHTLRLAADRYTPTDEALIPTGEIVSVEGTPFDFRQATSLGARIQAAGGYDLSYLQNSGKDVVATLEDPDSGRRLEVITSSPAIVLYTGNGLDGSLVGKGHVSYRQHAGLCLETGYLPDSVHHASFPSIILRRGGTYREVCIYRFSAK